MERKLHYVVVPEDGVFVARCLDVEVASDGPTEHDAVAHLREALALYFEGGEEASTRVTAKPERRDGGAS